MKDRKIKLTDKDLHIIDVYSKKNLSDTMQQFNVGGKQMSAIREMTSVQNEK